MLPRKSLTKHKSKLIGFQYKKITPKILINTGIFTPKSQMYQMRTGNKKCGTTEKTMDSAAPFSSPCHINHSFSFNLLQYSLQR